MSTLLKCIAPDFFYFVEHLGFVVAKSSHNPEEFGNSSVIITSSKFDLHVYTDRGQKFVDIGTTKNGWHKLEYVLEFLDPSITSNWLEEPPRIERLSDVLVKKIESVSRLLSGDMEANGFKEFEGQKTALLVASIFKEQGG